MCHRRIKKHWVLTNWAAFGSSRRSREKLDCVVNCQLTMEAFGACGGTAWRRYHKTVDDDFGAWAVWLKRRSGCASATAMVVVPDDRPATVLLSLPRAARQNKEAYAWSHGLDEPHPSLDMHGDSTRGRGGNAIDARVAERHLI